MVFSSCMVFDKYNYYLTTDSSIPASYHREVSNKVAYFNHDSDFEFYFCYGAIAQVVSFFKKYTYATYTKVFYVESLGTDKWLPIFKNTTTCTCISAVVGKSKIQEN